MYYEVAMNRATNTRFKCFFIIQISTNFLFFSFFSSLFCNNPHAKAWGLLFPLKNLDRPLILWDVLKTSYKNGIFILTVYDKGDVFVAKEKKQKVTPEDAHTNKIGIKEGMGYMLGDAGNLFVLTYVSSFLKIFYTEVLKISTKKVANLFLFTRLWDAVNDPLWGAVVAKRKPGPSGKFRGYIKFIAIPLALSQLLCFFNVQRFTQNQTYLLIFAYITYIAFGMLYTGMNVPFGSLASVITDDPDGRTLLSTFRTIGGGIGGAAPLLLAPYIIYDKIYKADGTLDHNEANGQKMFIFAVIMAVCAIIFYLACYGTTKERVPSEAEPKVDMKATYGGMLKSRPFIALAITGILISGQLQFASLNQYLYKNYFCNTNLSVIGTVANYLPMVIMIPIVPKLVKKFGKKEICSVGGLLAAIAAVATYVLKPSPDQAWLYMVLLFVIGFGYSFISITNWAVVADVIDYQEFTTHIRSESAIYAVYTFCRKLGQTAADYGGLTLLAKVGYDISMTSTGFVEGVSQGILKVCTIIPAITYSLIFTLYQFAYPLTKEKLEPIYSYVRASHEVAAESAEND